MLGGAAPAQSQESQERYGETEEVVGTLQASCAGVRNASGLPGADLVVVCDRDDQVSEDDPQRCRLISSDGFIDGLARNFCPERFPDSGRLIAAGDYEAGKTIKATSFGVNTGLTLEPSGATADILCQTFKRPDAGASKGGKPTAPASSDVRACRKIVEGSCGGGGCPKCDDLILTKSDSCESVQAQLAGTVTPEPAAEFAFAYVYDVDKSAQPGSAALLVCPGYKWECVDQQASTIQASASVLYDVDLGSVFTPGCYPTTKGWVCIPK